MNTKKTTLITLLMLMTFGTAFAQVVSESAKRKVTIGFDIFTDIWQNKPLDMQLRTIHQGANVFGMYNFKLADGPSTLGIGLGISNHNMYSDSRIDSIRGSVITFSPITEPYKRSKINMTYLDIPIELKIRFKNEMKLGIGFKIGYLINSKEKYVGNTPTTSTVTIKQKYIAQTQDYAYGFTLRFGIRSFNLFGYYQISQLFTAGRGPELYPISIGLTLTPF